MKGEELFALLRRRGVLWPTAEIYGGAQGLYDYGPLGAALKGRLEEAWTSWFLGLSDDYYRIEPSEILPEAVVRASGHLENFTDAEVDCASCHSSFRAESALETVRPQGVDGLAPTEIAELIRASGIRCPVCGSRELSVPKPFNLMFGLDFGPTGRERAYLRPETAQNSYLAFSRMWDVGRRSLPLGIAVIGRAYRNEIAPRQHLFRLRAFTQAELQVFFDPTSFHPPILPLAEEILPVVRSDGRGSGDGPGTPVRAADLVDSGSLPEFYVYHMVQLYRFYRDVLGYPAEAIRLWEKSAEERAFYNRIQFDFEVRLGSLGGFRELGALHYRGDYDLGRHSAASKKDLAVTLPEGLRILPHVLEITFGVDRNIWALAELHLTAEGDRTVWRLPPYLAPEPVGVYPLLKKEHGPAALGLLERLRSAGIRARFDDAGSIGRRYARMDEAGAPFGVTVDGETIDPASPNHGTVTLRERDSKRQERIAVDALPARIAPALRPPRPPVAT